MSTLNGRAALFGYPSAPVAATVQARPRGWRISGAARAVGIALVLAPVAAVVPPHAPWAIGVLIAGVYFARRRWRETHTLMWLEGACPRCGHDFEVKPVRLERPHPLECDGCHHVSALSFPDGQVSA